VIVVLTNNMPYCVYSYCAHKKQKVEYFMSAVSRKVLSSLTQDYLWMRTLTNQPESKLTEQLTGIVKEFQAAAKTSQVSTAAASALPTGAATAAPSARGARSAKKDADSNTTSTSSSRSNMNPRTKEYNKAIKHLADVASEQQAETILKNTKKHIFS